MSEERAWHTLDVEETFDILESSPGGLHPPEVERRLEEYGPNEIEEAEGVSKLDILWAQIKNPLVLVLVIAGLISLAAGKTADAIVIAVVIVVNTLIGFFQEYQAEEALQALKSQAAPEAEVLRDCPDEGGCIEESVPATQIVPGDVIMLDAGAKVPADARLFEAANLEVDEAMLTGESTTVRKTVEPLEGELPTAERTNLVYGGTMVTSGRGRAVIYASGSQTEMGKIATLIQETEKAPSPLQRQTLNLSKKLGILAVSVATLTLVLGVIRGLDLQEMLLFALASAVSSIPEGLPAVMSITLAVGVNRMAKRNAIIRRLQAVDTLGAATVICTDKTGTLTTNQMTVQRVMAGGETFGVTGVGFAPEGHFQRDGEDVDPTSDPDVRLALHIGALCNDARLVQHYDNDDFTWEIRGEPTEGALVVAAAKAGEHKEETEERFHRIDELPFSSARKFMATFHSTPEEDEAYIFVKGAPETVLDMCTQVREDGAPRPLSDKDRARIMDENNNMANDALRVLGLAYQVIAPDEAERHKEALEYGHDVELVFAGLAGMMDPPRSEVPEAVARCKQAGVRVIMATGDHRLTGEAIAREVGITDDDGQSLTGADVEKMDDDALDEAVEETAVFARVSPEHKHRIVESLRRRGHVVAMTGDGVNDAPALQAADIGVAMGITGTDVTRETAEMVLTDDNFASIVNAIEEGRGVFQNVRKVVKFLLATNIGEDLTLISALAFLSSCCLPITPVQILWVNLVTDGILDITIALEPKEGDVMNEPPRKPDARIINREILLNIFFVAIFMAIGTLGMFVWADGSDNLAYTQTTAFTTLAMFQVFNALNCRSRTKSVFQLGLFSNRWLVGAVAASILLQIFAEHVPFMQAALGTVPLGLKDWGMIVLVSSSIFVADELRKLVSRSRSNG
ncbi:MAG: cation-translocating P-type ATPase [Anaerolineales bacterium]